MNQQPRLAVVILVLALVALACSSGEDADEAEPTAPVTSAPPVTEGDSQAAPDPATELEVTVQCARGDSLSTAPADTVTIGFLDGVDANTPWVQRVVTVENGTDSTARIDPGLAIRYLDESGSLIAEAPLDEPYLPALTAAPGQTVNRNTVRFGVPDQVGLVADQDDSATLFSSLGSCEVGAEPIIVPVADDELIDPQLAGQVDLTECGPTDDGARYEATFQVRNPSQEPIQVEVGFEILDESGERLGTGGNEADVAAEGEATITGFAAGFTVLNLEEAADCALLSATVV